MGLFRSEEQYIEYSTNIKETFYSFVDRPQFIDKNVDGFSGEINGDSFYFYKNHLFMSKARRTVLFGRIINDHTISYCYGKFSWAQAAIICFCAVLLVFTLNDVLRAVLYGDNINLSENLLTLSLGLLVAASFAFVKPKVTRELLYNHLLRICGQTTMENSDIRESTK